MTILSTDPSVTDAVRHRQAIEQLIAACVVEDLLEAGYRIVAARGPTGPTPPTFATIMSQLGEADEDNLMVYDPDNYPPLPADGWVHLVYGNEGHDVISDYTANLEYCMKRANALAVTINVGS
mgnify:CR=1 FL=1